MSMRTVEGVTNEVCSTIYLQLVSTAHSLTSTHTHRSSPPLLTHTHREWSGGREGAWREVSNTAPSSDCATSTEFISHTMTRPMCSK